jgi:hypothetical protein
MNAGDVQICAQVVGKRTITIYTFVDPDGTIDEMLALFAQELAILNEPFEFDAYITGKWSEEDTAECEALDKRDPTAMSICLSPLARLDPSKTLADYVEDDDLDPDTIIILLDWSPASWNEHFVRARSKEAQYFAQQQMLLVSPTTRTPPWILVPFQGLQLRAVVVEQQHKFVVSIMVEPSDTIAKLLELFAFQLHWLKKRHVFDAYVAKLGDQWPLKAEAPQCVTVEAEALDLVEGCMTPANRLNPMKKVADYVGQGEDLEWATVALVLDIAEELPADDVAMESATEQL